MADIGNGIETRLVQMQGEIQKVTVAIREQTIAMREQAAATLAASMIATRGGTTVDGAVELCRSIAAELYKQPKG